MAPATVSGRRQIHRYIRILLARPRPSATGVAGPSVLGADSGSTSSKRRKTSQDNDSFCHQLLEQYEALVREGVQEHEQGSQEQAASSVAAAPAPPDGRVRTRTTVGNVTVCDADALECGVCFLALSPPIFQCEVGHVVCSACHEKLEATGNGKCHICGVATRGGYRRCHAMENLVDCIRVPCPYAAHGCDSTPPYHGQETHRQTCLYAPCHCPGDTCGFVGSTVALLDHFTGVHKWPCTTKVRAMETFSIQLSVGFNFFLLEDHGRSCGEQAPPVPHLFLLNVTRERLGRAISVLCKHPNASAAANGAQQLPLMQCELVFSRNGDRSLCHSHYQSSVFNVVCTDLSNGLPNPEDCFQFLVPNAVLEVGVMTGILSRLKHVSSTRSNRLVCARQRLYLRPAVTCTKHMLYC